MKVECTLVFSAIFLLGCGGSRESEIRPVTETSIFSEAVVESWGYRTTGIGVREQEGWDKENFGEAKIRAQSIKSINELEDWEHTYFSFTIQEQTFQTKVQARERIVRVQDTPPREFSKQFPERVLSDGFAHGRIAYIISTGSTRFNMEIPHMIELLRAEVVSQP